MVNWLYPPTSDAAISIGANNADNEFASDNVVTNDDGSVLERLEGIKDRLSATDSATNILGADDADNGFASTNVVRNKDGSIIERLEDITAELSGAAGIATWPAAAAAGNAVSIAEVLRYIEDALVGTNGVVTWPAAAAPGNGVSLAEAIRYVVETQVGTITNSGGTATLGGILGDVANVSLATRTAVTNSGGTATLNALLGDFANSSLVTRLNLLQGQTPATYVPGLGFRVTKVENINTATGVDLFTVTGKVLIKLWTGEVTNALGAAVTDYKLRIKTDNVDLCAATDISSAAIGYMWSLSGDAGLTLLTGSSYAVSAVKTADNNAIGLADRIVGLGSGTCTLQSLRTAGDASDSMTHVLFYLPLEASASVVAA